MNAINLLCFALGVVTYTISQLAQHGKLQHWSKEARGYWGFLSHTRKYKKGTKEPAFLLSTTLLVFLTDGYHLCQMLFKVLFIITVVTYEPFFVMFWDFVLYFALWQVVFNVTYKVAGK